MQDSFVAMHGRWGRLREPDRRSPTCGRRWSTGPARCCGTAACGPVRRARRRRSTEPGADQDGASAPSAAAPCSTRCARCPTGSARCSRCATTSTCPRRHRRDPRHQPRRREEPRVAGRRRPALPCPHCWRRPHEQRLPTPTTVTCAACSTTPCPTCTPRRARRDPLPRPAPLGHALAADHRRRGRRDGRGDRRWGLAGPARPGQQPAVRRPRHPTRTLPRGPQRDTRWTRRSTTSAPPPPVPGSSRRRAGSPTRPTATCRWPSTRR